MKKIIKKAIITESNMTEEEYEKLKEQFENSKLIIDKDLKTATQEQIICEMHEQMHKTITDIKDTLKETCINDEKLISKAIVLNSPYFLSMILVILFVFASGYGIYCLKNNFHNFDEEILVIPVFILSIIIFFLGNYMAEKIGKHFVYNHLNDFQMERAKLIKIKRPLFGQYSHLYESKIYAELKTGKTIKGTIDKKREETFSSLPYNVYVVKIPKLFGKYFYDIYSSKNFTNKCKKIKL